VSNLFPDDFGQLDRWDGVGTRRVTQLDANRALDRTKFDPSPAPEYTAADLPGVDPHGYIALAKGMFAMSIITIIAAAGIVIGWLIFGVFS